MNFDFSEEQRLLQKTARDFLSERCPLSVARGVLESDAAFDEPLWKGVAEMGWLGAAIPESFGGAGYGRLELALLAQELGRALAPLPFASSVYLVTEALLMAGSDAQKERYLPRLAAGELVGAFALSEGPGRSESDALQTTYREGRVRGCKIPVADAARAGIALVAVRDAESARLVLVDLSGEGVEVGALRSFDPSRPLGRIVLRDAPGELLGADGGDAALIEHLMDRAAVLMAFEQLGGAERAFELTRAYCLDRFAFGRPIASFQALKHRMVDCYAEIQLATANAYYGAWALESESRELASAACAARVAASEAFSLAAAEMIQMHGGVAFTWEYDCHLFYRRALALGLALGPASAWRERLVRQLEA
ncbi:MAG: acyl-CoA/acyl-ACP dehydrogenase [Myxococcales bacterium]|nr:acyl-CoA/acyl-ACP dehydrogenase [Myxococcales bacterium]MDH5567982.1 acyl-CoA/acyl-ACP dehydrogenase [Myxococcales bacterium]